jgi:hypothetical protein
MSCTSAAEASVLSVLLESGGVHMIWRCSATFEGLCMSSEPMLKKFLRPLRKIPLTKQRDRQLAIGCLHEWIAGTQTLCSTMCYLFWDSWVAHVAR